MYVNNIAKPHLVCLLYTCAVAYITVMVSDQPW